MKLSSCGVPHYPVQAGGALHWKMVEQQLLTGHDVTNVYVLETRQQLQLTTFYLFKLNCSSLMDSMIKIVL